MEKYTPTPWQQHDPEYCPLEIWGALDGPSEVGAVRGVQVCEVLTGERDAAFIVRACNSYDSLTAQRDDLLAACKAWAAAEKAESEFCHTQTPDDSVEYVNRVVQVADQKRAAETMIYLAIAKAEPGREEGE